MSLLLPTSACHSLKISPLLMQVPKANLHDYEQVGAALYGHPQLEAEGIRAMHQLLKRASQVQAHGDGPPVTWIPGELLAVVLGELHLLTVKGHRKLQPPFPTAWRKCGFSLRFWAPGSTAQTHQVPLLPMYLAFFPFLLKQTGHLDQKTLLMVAPHVCQEWRQACGSLSGVTIDFGWLGPRQGEKDRSVPPVGISCIVSVC
jgi:hypothetical protein